MGDLVKDPLDPSVLSLVSPVPRPATVEIETENPSSSLASFLTWPLGCQPWSESFLEQNPECSFLSVSVHVYLPDQCPFGRFPGFLTVACSVG